MKYDIELTTRDGESLSFTCGPDQNLIDAALGANLILPSQCRQGACGVCHAQVTAGGYVLGEHNRDALPATGDGNTLLCRTTACSDLRIQLPVDRSRILDHGVARRQARIESLDTVALNTVCLQLRLIPDPDLGAGAEFEPGQYMEIEVPGSEERRAYSLANTPNWDGVLEFLIRLQPGGRFSDYLRGGSRAGDTLTLFGPQGAFGLDPCSLRARWFVAGGTGLAPMLSMLRRMAEFQETNEGRLFFGVNREDELCLLDELERLRAELPQLAVTLCVWKPQGDWQGLAGTPADALAQALTGAAEHPDIYLCGPPAMIDAAQRAAQAAGVPAAQCFSERFLSA